MNGQISLVGWLAKEKPLIDIQNFAATVGSIHRIAAGHRKHHLEMNRAVEASGIKPVIDRVFNFESAKAAYNYFAKGNHPGKVVISIP